jgi:hypothetical protein
MMVAIQCRVIKTQQVLVACLLPFAFVIVMMKRQQRFLSRFFFRQAMVVGT